VGVQKSHPFRGVFFFRLQDRKGVFVCDSF